jgi:hypothetical protein
MGGYRPIFSILAGLISANEAVWCAQVGCAVTGMPMYRSIGIRRTVLSRRGQHLGRNP